MISRKVCFIVIVLAQFDEAMCAFCANISSRHYHMFQTFETSLNEVHRRETLNASVECGSKGWMVFGPKCGNFRTLRLSGIVLSNFIGVVLKSG